MSNPDFPGPSWQDRSPFPGEPRYGRGPDHPDRAAYSAADGPGGRGYQDQAGGGSRGYDARRGYTAAANGRDHADGGGNGYGRGADYAGRGGNGYGRGGYSDRVGNGYGRDGDYGGLNDDDLYRPTGGDNGRVGRGRLGLRGLTRGRRGRAYADDGTYADDGIDLDPMGPGGPGGPGDPGWRSRDYVEPRRPRPSGSWVHRQWRASWWRRWTIKKAAFLIGGTAAGLVLVLIAGFFYAYSTVQVPLRALNAPLIQSSQVYFAGGKTPIGCFCSQNRTVLTADQLAQDKYLEPAFFAAEDRRFLTEGGISVTGTARAILVDLFGSGVQGGSTITEQLVKAALLPSGIGNLTYKEKLKEIIIAIKLAKTQSKSWILTHYLNEINLGWGAYGVEAAAGHYFGKHAWQLSIAQCAMLAAMVQYPSFDPTDPGQVVPYLGYSLVSRWVAVLNNMAHPAAQTVGITQQQLQAILPVPSPTSRSQLLQDLRHFPKIVPPSKSTGSWGHYRGYIMTDVMTELRDVYGLTPSEVYNSGLRIVTTISKPKMDALYAAVKQAKSQMGGLPWYAHVGAVLENSKTGAIEAVYEGPKWDPGTKYCKRYKCQYPMATFSRNQVGSSFKPYVLSAAVQEGMNVKTSILNGYSPICVPPETMPLTESKRSSPKNCPTQWLGVDYDPVVEGPVRVDRAAALSSNAAFEDLAHRVGTRPIIDLARNFGVNIGTAPPKGMGSGLQDDIGKIGIALGIAPLTVEEQATTFATLADNGIYHTPHMIASLTQNGHPIPLKVYSHRVLTPAQDADVNWALSFDTIYGTGYPNAVLSPARPTIAKTGTTDVAQSAFFIGALPQQYSFAVGMFTNSQNNVKGGQSLDVLPSIGGAGGGYGGAWPATIWRLFMTRILAMGNPPVSQLAPLDLNGFQKWVQVKPVQPKCKPGPPFPGGPGGGGGGGQGNGHHHHGIKPGGLLSDLLGPKQPCKGGPGPSPSPTPTSPSPTPTSPSPTPTSPSPTPTLTLGPMPVHVPGPRPRPSAPSLTTSAVLTRQLVWRPLWAPVPTGLL